MRLLRGLVLGTSLAIATLARAEAPAPSQALASDPQPRGPALGLGVDGAAMILGDFAVRLDVVLDPALSLHVGIGLSRRGGRDDLLGEAGLVVWPLAGVLGQGLEGPWVETVAGGAWSGPWTGQEGGVLRLGGEIGWQFLWRPVTFSVGAGAHAMLGRGPPGLEPRITGALGLTW